MCGIVAYFGSSPDSIARVLTGMSAIIYRAPDSTGIGIFGNLDQPVVQRKTLGSVAGMADVMERSPFFENPDARMLQLFGPHPEGCAGIQEKLLDAEGLPKTLFQRISNGDVPRPTIRDMITGEQGLFTPLTPGIPGNPDPPEPRVIKSRKDLRSAIHYLLFDLNIAPVVIQAMFRNRLSQALSTGTPPLPPGTEAADIYNAFDHLFQIMFRELRPVKSAGQRAERAYINPHARKYLWRMISGIHLVPPTDFDTDGVRGIFRILDQGLVSRLTFNRGIEDTLDEKLKASMPKGSTALGWRSLYRMEKGANVYGRAAAVALEHLAEIIPGHDGASGKTIPVSPLKMPSGVRPGILAFLAQPVIGHGRWALQSSVTVTNAHPFTDETCRRTIALNGQFSPEVEEELALFLTTVAGIRLRTENSAEYFSQLWGYYWDSLKEKQKHYREVIGYVEKELDEYAMGVSSVNYQILRLVQGKSRMALDEMAFIEAAKKFTKKGGQIAVAGISQESPGTLYVASSNRPVFIVRRSGTQDIMVVSDVNAAIGLFSQSHIASVTREYDRLAEERESTLALLEADPELKKRWQDIDAGYTARIDVVLAAFSVDVYTLEGDGVFAVIKARNEGTLSRAIEIRDFSGRQHPSLEPSTINLTPPHVHRDLDKSFFESHMEEVPDLLDHILESMCSSGIMTAPQFFSKAPLVRRFGSRLKNMKRILIAGMGSSFHVSRFVREMLSPLLPDLEILAFQPVEIKSITDLVDPDGDFVLLMTWSGTTADMVKLAGRLLEHHVLFAAVTEKPFGDIALIARKSCGIIPAMSGEEVTVPAVKSTFCTLMAGDLFLLWLIREIMGGPGTDEMRDSLVSIPATVRRMIGDGELKERIIALAFEHAQCRRIMIIDTLHTSGSGDEVLLKFQEMTWSVTGTAVDYSDMDVSAAETASRDGLIIVNATTSGRLVQALAVMEELAARTVPFLAVTWDGPHTRDVQTLSGKNLILLPQIIDPFQAFFDLIFYYYLALAFAKVKGRAADAYPRNRAKSVTTSRSEKKPDTGYREEVPLLIYRNSLLPEPPEEPKENASPGWDSLSFNENARNRFSGLRKLSRLVSDPRGLEALLQFEETLPAILGNALFGNEPVRELLFYPLDRVAEAAAKTAAFRLNPRIPCRIRVLKRFSRIRCTNEDFLVLAVRSASGPADPGEALDTVSPERLVEVFPEETPQRSKNAMGYVRITGACREAEASALYAGLTLLLSRAWSSLKPEKGGSIETHFRKGVRVVPDILACTRIGLEIKTIMENNAGYNSVLLLSASDGTGMTAADMFARSSRLIPQAIPYGSGAHGALVTVENRLKAKYVRLKERREMIGEYGEESVLRWENRFLSGTRTDLFLESPANDFSSRVDTPFFAEGDWFFPVLKPGYTPWEDNLVVIDTLSETCFDDAVDDLSIFGCRHARMIVITQELFTRGRRQSQLMKYPLSGLISLPSLPGKEGPLPISDLHVPLVLDLVTAALAGSSERS